MTLTVAAARSILNRSFASPGALDAMRAVGIIPRGAAGRSGSARLGVHDAVLVLLTVALDTEGSSGAALQLALRARDWRAVDVAPGWRMAPGCAVVDVSDVAWSRC